MHKSMMAHVCVSVHFSMLVCSVCGTSRTSRTARTLPYFEDFSDYTAPTPPFLTGLTAATLSSPASRTTNCRPPARCRAPRSSEPVKVHGCMGAWGAPRLGSNLSHNSVFT